MLALAELNLTGFTSDVPPTDRKELQRFNFEIVCRSDAAMNHFWSFYTNGKVPDVIVRAAAYSYDPLVLPRQEIFNPHFSQCDSRRPVLLRGCLGRMTWGVGKKQTRVQASANLCERYFRRIRFSATDHVRLIAKLHELEPRLEKKGYYTGHLLDQHFIELAWEKGDVWVMGHRFAGATRK
jgi:hypothetical protein